MKNKLTNKEKKKIQKEGFTACKEGIPSINCPYARNTEEWKNWIIGYDECIEEDYLWMDL